MTSMTGSIKRDKNAPTKYPFELIVDNSEYRYGGSHHREESICRLRIYQTEDMEAVVIFTELPDNPGMSVTNAAEILANSVSVDFEIYDDITTWIEHYPDEYFEKYGREPHGYGETYDFILYECTDDGVCHNAHWQNTNKQEIEELLQEELNGPT